MLLIIKPTYCPCYNLISTLFPTQGHHVVYMCSDIIFQILLLYFRPMISYHVTYHVTAVSYAFFIVQKKKKNKINIKSEKSKKIK